MRTLHHFSFALAVVCVTALTVMPAQAQLTQSSSSSSATDTPLWSIHLNLQKSFASPLGQRLVEMVEDKNPEGYQKFIKLVEAIGLDPRTEVGEVAMFGDGFGERDATIIAQLGSSTGNLEGWIIAAPGYRSEELDANTMLHSLLMEDEGTQRAWFALPKQSSGNYMLIGSLDKNRTIELAQDVLGGASSIYNQPLTGDSIMSFAVNNFSEIPVKIDDTDPGSAIVKMIESVGFNVASNDSQLQLEMNIGTNNPAKAKQISQLLTGLKAMVQLVEDPEVQKLASIIGGVEISHTEGAAQVKAQLSAPYEMLERLVTQLEHSKRK